MPLTLYQKLVKDLNRDILSPDIAIAILEKHGFEEIGSGAFSAIYGRDDVPFVVKINKEHDPGAFQFYSTISRKPAKHFPKVHKLMTYVDDLGRFYFIVVMERLDRLEKDTWKKKINEDSRNFIHWLTAHPHSLMKKFTKSDTKASNKWSKRNRASEKTILSMLSFVEKFAVADFHEDNVMIRMPQGDVVLTDPLCTYIDYHATVQPL